MKKEMIEMGAMCEEAIALAARALTEGNMSLAEKVAPLSQNIDQMERDIESRCLKLLLQQQPVAKDLRAISAALKMITDMERIGDQAEDITEILPYLSGRAMPVNIPMREMAAAAIRMVTDSVDAYVKQNTDMAQSVIDRDDVIDGYFASIKQNLIDLLKTYTDSGEFAIDLLMIGKYLERIGDHATNIAEWVIFSVTGVHKEVQT
ncbi:MAG: phosphate signaling complex protein PhoU [Clostridia bacterium]|nr:phosphate signaling complex protein PhoU [Clostridia bacterium]